MGLFDEVLEDGEETAASAAPAEEKKAEKQESFEVTIGRLNNKMDGLSDRIDKHGWILLIISVVFFIVSMTFWTKTTPPPPQQLLAAARRNDLGEMKRILARGTDVDARGESYTDDDTTALIIASGNGSKETVEFLLRKGADINDADASSNSALMLAAKSGRKEVVELLIARGADVNAERDHVFGEDTTALEAAAKYGRKEIAEILIKAGARK